MSHVLLINGSPHKNGCTFTALNEIKAALEKENITAEIFHIGNHAVHGCNGCDCCSELKHCVYSDDVCNEMIEKMKQADGIIVGSPVYYSGPNGAFTALLDRAFYVAGKTFRQKPAAAIVSCRRGGASAAFDRLNKYFTIAQMPVVSSQYWNAVHGNTPEEVLQDKEGLQIMRTLASNMAWMLNCIEQSNIPKPIPEPRESTNFIR